MNDHEHEDNVVLLKEVIQNSQKFAVFVGSGASSPLGIKTWKKLLMDFVDRFGIEIDIEKSIYDKGYPQTASEIYNLIGNHDDYINFLNDQFEPTSCSYTSLHETILDNFTTIFTTNFDVAFENAFNYKQTGFNTQKFPNFDPFSLFETPTIVYLHGNNKERKYVFRKEEYEIYYPSISGTDNGSFELENFLKNVFTRISLVFIGFSFDDGYFTKFFKKTLKEEALKEMKIHQDIFNVPNPKRTVPHFAIMGYEQSFDEENKHSLIGIKDIGLRLILYKKGRYVEIEDLIKTIMPTRKSIN